MKRFVLVGTAPSWTQAPWNDPDAFIVSLNDAYRMKGFVRADAWFDTHPTNKFWTVPAEAKQIMAHQVPAGYYVRPAGHLDWLAEQAHRMPVYLHPDHATLYPPSAHWPMAVPYPKAEAEAYFGRYYTSSPAWMLGLALMQGYTDFEIYGIHLATEHEYIEQRPCFEFFCGRILGRGKTTETRKDGKRYYETAEGRLVLPEASPVLDSDFQYGYDTRPRAHLEPLKWDAHRFQVKRDRALRKLRAAPWWQRTQAVKDEIAWWEAHLADTQDAMGRLTLAADLQRGA